MHLRRALLVVLVPAIAVAAPKPHKKPKTKTTTPATEPAATPETTTDKDTGGGGKDAVKDVPTPPATLSATPAGGGGGGASGSAAGGGSGDAKPDDTAKTNEPDVDSLRQEYLSLRDELFKSSARAGAVASALYSTRIQIKLTYTSARYYNPGKASIRLDGASVYDDASAAIAGDDGIRFSGYIAPGRHIITFHVEANGKDDDSFTSVTEAQVVVKAIGGKDLVVAAKAHDGGDIAYEWKKSERGSYGLGIDVGVTTLARPDETKAGKK